MKLNTTMPHQAQPTVYSIGYATKSVQQFLEQLQRYHITVIADVRSVPYSNYFYDYDTDKMQLWLKQAGIRYVYLGNELGPRSKNLSHYDDAGQVQFDRLMVSDLFKRGIQRLQNGMKKKLIIALLCAEKDPAVCHRSLLIGHALNRYYGVCIQHIRHDGSLESELALQQRIVQMHEVEQDFFRNEAQCFEEAYQRQSKKYAYIKPS